MDITSATASAAAQTQNPQAQNAQGPAGIAQDFNTFLTLLTTQLQNQDPLEPTDSNEFTKQLVAFAGVEQQITANEKLDNLASLAALNQTTAAVSYLGRDVTIAGNELSYDGETPETFQFNLDRASQNVDIEIRDGDGAGKTVFETNTSGRTGFNRFTWNGVDEDGEPVAAGLYRVLVKSRTEAGKESTAATAVRARVEEVSSNGTTPLLTVAGQQIPLSEVLAISEPQQSNISQSKTEESTQSQTRN